MQMICKLKRESSLNQKRKVESGDLYKFFGITK